MRVSVILLAFGLLAVSASALELFQHEAPADSASGFAVQQIIELCDTDNQVLKANCDECISATGCSKSSLWVTSCSVDTDQLVLKCKPAKLTGAGIFVLVVLPILAFIGSIIGCCACCTCCPLHKHMCCAKRPDANSAIPFSASQSGVVTGYPVGQYPAGAAAPYAAPYGQPAAAPYGQPAGFAPAPYGQPPAGFAPAQ